MLCVGTGQLCSWGSWAAEQQQRLDVRITASEANEHTGSNPHFDGKTLQRVSVLLLLLSMMGYKQSLCGLV